jgi:hypothetical protein
MQLIPSRIIRAQIPQLFAQLKTGKPDEILFGYPVHHDRVPSREAEKLRNLADRIVNSYDTNAPIVAVTIVGHADRELSVQGEAARKKSERNHSEARAAEATDLLIRFIKGLRPRAQTALDRTMFNRSGVGATQLVVAHPTNELDRRKNRRVEIFLGQSLATPVVPVPPEINPPLPPDPKNDPNTILASNKFRIKEISAVSGGDVVGVTGIRLLIWDTLNNRAAKYTYISGTTTAGTPISITPVAGSFSPEFTTPIFMQVNQFSGAAQHAQGGGLDRGNLFLTFSTSDALASFRQFSVRVPSGFTLGLGVEQGKGHVTLENGSVQVFTGR